MNTKHFLRALTAILGLAVAIPASAQTCRSDLNGDGIVANVGAGNNASGCCWAGSDQRDGTVGHHACPGTVYIRHTAGVFDCAEHG